MGLRYLLDTNILSEPLRERPSEYLLSQLEAHHGELATASTVVHEMIHGYLILPKGKRRTRIEDYVTRTLADLTVFPYDDDAARWHAAERARLDAKGKPTPLADGQIAAVAAVHGLVLVSANVKDMRHFQVSVENWIR